MTDLSSNLGVLIVDDDERVSRATARLLRPEGMNVWTASSPGEALARLEQGLAREVQVVISDYRMPGMTGVELLSAILERWPRIERILFTGQADAEALGEAINQAQVSRLLSKPIDDATLVATVRTAVEHYALAAENERLHALLREQNTRLVEANRDLAGKVAERTTLLSRAKREWEVAFDAIGEPLMLLDSDYRVVRANLALAAHMGVEIRGAPGHICHELRARSSPHRIPRDPDGVCTGCPVKRLRSQREVAEGEVLEGEVVTLSNRTVHVRAYPIAHEAVDGVVCVYRDLTEDRALRRQVAQADKLSAIGLLAGGVAHEINNPLGAILAFTQILLRELVDGSEREEYLRDVEANALRCKEIVMRLLSFARQTRPDDVRPFDVNEVVVETALLVEKSLLPPGVVLRRELAPELPDVLGNSNELTQVLVNLVTNARDAMPSGGGTIRVRTRHLVDEGAVELAVIDTGVGIPESEIEKIFDPFFTTKPEGKGTGLGLAVSYGIVRNMKGRITVTSRVGEGTEFRVVIPQLSSGRDMSTG